MAKLSGDQRIVVKAILGSVLFHFLAFSLLSPLLLKTETPKNFVPSIIKAELRPAGEGGQKFSLQRSYPRIRAAGTAPLLELSSKNDEPDARVVEVMQGGAHVPDSADVAHTEDMIRWYRLQFARQARQFAGSALLAERAGAGGLSIIRVVWIAGGGLPAVSLDESSGDPATDEMALAIVHKTLMSAEMPEGLTKLGVSFRLPIRFSRE